MRKITVSLLLIATIFVNVACANNDKFKDNKIIETEQTPIISSVESEDNETASKSINKGAKMIDMPIQINSNGIDEIKYLELREDSSLQDKIETITKTISQESFNGLPIKATVCGSDIVKVELVELSDDKESRVTWKQDYLNEHTKESTIDNIVKNILQDGYKGPWIDKVKLYYNEELITLD